LGFPDRTAFDLEFSTNPDELQDPAAARRAAGGSSSKAAVAANLDTLKQILETDGGQRDAG
jgi:hypothetical protein